MHACDRRVTCLELYIASAFRSLLIALYAFEARLAPALLPFSSPVVFLQVCLAVMAVIRLRRGVLMANDSNVPPLPDESASAPPSYAASVYGDDARFSPHPFAAKPGENLSATTEQPAY